MSKISNSKNQKSFNKNQNKSDMVQYYTMDEKFKMEAAFPAFNQALNETVQGFAYQNRPFPEGEVMCVICKGKKSWFSSSRESLIAIIESKKQPMYYMNLDA